MTTKKKTSPKREHSYELLEVEYGQSFNTGNYSSERFSLRARLNGEPYNEVIGHLRKRIFFLSKEGKRLLAQAREIERGISEEFESPASEWRKAWAAAVLRGEETRSQSESRKDYE